MQMQHNKLSSLRARVYFELQNSPNKKSHALTDCSPVKISALTCPEQSRGQILHSRMSLRPCCPGSVPHRRPPGPSPQCSLPRRAGPACSSTGTSLPVSVEASAQRRRRVRSNGLRAEVLVPVPPLTADCWSQPCRAERSPRSCGETSQSRRCTRTEEE